MLSAAELTQLNEEVGALLAGNYTRVRRLELDAAVMRAKYFDEGEREDGGKSEANTDN